MATKNFMDKWMSVFRVLLYVLAVVIILYALPKEAKFGYEYQKGSPWKHDDLVAPFNFAIYKTNKEIEEEKEYLKKETKLYFTKNSEVKQSIIDNFDKNFDKIIAHDRILDSISKIKAKDLKNIIKTSLAEVYNKGICTSNKLYNQDGSLILSLYVKSDDITQRISGNDLYTIQTANQYIKDEISTYLVKAKRKLQEDVFHEIETFCYSLDLNQWLESNIIYDDELTLKVLKDNIDNISTTKGMILEGQRIIYKGEMVSDQEFRVLESLRKEYEQSDSRQGTMYTYIGQSIIISLLFVLIYIFLKTFRKEIFYQTKYSALILFLTTLLIVGISLVVKYNSVNIFLVPFLLLPIIIKTFFDTRTGLFFHITACTISGFIAPNGFEYVMMNFLPGYFLLISFEQINRRGLIFRSALVCFVMYVLVYISFEFMHCEFFDEINFRNIVYLALNCLMLLLAYPLIYIVEKLFGFVSDVSLQELADSNRPLLSRLSLEAPGTFQHSMQVANLAEAAVNKIGGDSHLARVGALYHDIGKLTAPMYFTENQVSGINPHDQLDYIKSAEVIINHVIKGVELAKKYNLPRQIIDFITMHHGTSKVMYFYKMYQKDHPNEPIDDSLFSYPGPRPISKEAAVVMMADSVEAASKSLKKIDNQTISTLVDNIIAGQLSQGQFNNTKLTLRDIETVKELFKEKLLNIYHARIEYPK